MDHAAVDFDAKMVERACDAIRQRVERVPLIGLVLGTGLGDLADQLSYHVAVDFDRIPGFPIPTALAHRGRLVFGTFAGHWVVAMQGRCHLYEGRSPSEVTFGVRTLAALGMKYLFLTNAAGGLNPRFSAGDVMVVEDHINLMFQIPPSTGPAPRGEPYSSRPVARRTTNNLYDRHLIAAAERVARNDSVGLQKGVYVGVTGPNYETRAEYRMMRRLGGDAVGMSTVLEALAARQSGVKVAAFSAITNIARPDAPDVVDANEVVDVAENVAPKIRAILEGIIREIAE